jgi:CDP-glucose 4,6-dehydratase
VLRVDSTKARERLGWRPRWDLSRALDATIAWYEAVHAGAQARQVTLEQLAAYGEPPGPTVR